MEWIKVQSTEKTVKQIEVLQDRVYIRKNIIRIEKVIDGDMFSEWEYYETWIPLSEYVGYIETLGMEITDRELENLELGQIITDLELKLLELGV